MLTVGPALQPILTADGTIPLSTRLLAAVLWVATLGRRPIPFLPVIGLFYGLYYALPVVLDAALLNFAVWIDPLHDYQPAVVAALLGWGAVLAGYGVFREHRGWGPFQSVALETVLAPVWASRFLVAGLAIRIAVAIVPAAQVFGGLASFLASLVTLGIALLVVHWRRGSLATGYKLFTVGGIAIATFVEIGTGIVGMLGFIFVTIGLAFWAATPTRLPISAIAVLVVSASFMVVLKGVTAEFRSVAWGGDTTLSITDRAGLAGRLVRDRVVTGGAAAALTSGSDATVGRSSNTDLLAEIIRRTPADVPFWNGKTYLSLVGVFVPRLLWPDKPTKNLGQDFGHRYRFLDARDDRTSFNLPWLVEAYANFGWLGVILVGGIVGAIYALLFRLVNVPGQSVWATAVGIVVMLPLFNIESDFSLTFGGIPLTLVALWVILRAVSANVMGPRRQAAALYRPASY